MPNLERLIASAAVAITPLDEQVDVDGEATAIATAPTATPVESAPPAETASPPTETTAPAPAYVEPAPAYAAAAPVYAASPPPISYTQLRRALHPHLEGA
jgi:hypothetical protein